MTKLSNVRRKFLEEATSQYKKSLPGSAADQYLASRGLPPEVVAKFCLGYVADPLPGHDLYRGMLAIPYMRLGPAGTWSVVSMRFRCVAEGCPHDNHGKYMSAPGDTPRMFNTLALIRSDDVVGISEGEIDSITAELCGVPTVGIPGAESWKPYFREPFLGYETVYVFADGDSAGMRFADKVAKSLPNARIVPSSPGEDVNSEYRALGQEFLMERIGKR